MGLEGCRTRHASVAAAKDSGGRVVDVSNNGATVGPSTPTGLSGYCLLDKLQAFAGLCRLLEKGVGWPFRLAYAKSDI